MSDATQGQLERQREQWDAAADGWGKWWSFIERSTQTISDTMIARAEVSPGERVLDVATGIGEPAMSAARTVGANGKVIATDQAPKMIAIARQRASDLGLDNVELRVSDGGVPELEELVDAVLCRWGLMFFPDPAATLVDMHRVLHPAGRIAITVWAEAEKTPMLSTPMAVLGRALDLPRPPTDKPGLFSLSNVATLEQLFVSAGFEDIAIDEHTIEFEYDSVDQYIDSTLDLAAPVRTILGGQTDNRRQELLALIREAVGAFERSDKSVMMPSTAIVASARRS